MNTNECAKFLADKIPGASEIYTQHLNAHGEILLHVLAGDIIDKPPEELLQCRDRCLTFAHFICNNAKFMEKIIDNRG
ncbi:MAG: hypothetical protein IKS17_01825 [Firmicutes bacterium]|nr:hypothetical protein [Bacillota bacterium]